VPLLKSTHSHLRPNASPSLTPLNSVNLKISSNLCPFASELQILETEGLIRKNVGGKYGVVRDNVTPDSNLMTPIIAGLLLYLISSPKENTTSYVLASLTGTYHGAPDGKDRYAPILQYIAEIIGSCSLSTYNDIVELGFEEIIAELENMSNAYSFVTQPLQNMRAAQANSAEPTKLEALLSVYDMLHSNWHAILDSKAKFRIMSHLSIALDNAPDNIDARRLLFYAIMKSYFIIDSDTI